MAPPAFASGPMHVVHISGRCIILGDGGYEVICPGCSLDIGKAVKESKQQASLDIVYKGLHVENKGIFEHPNIKPLPISITMASQGMLVGRSIKLGALSIAVLMLFVLIVLTYVLGKNPSIENYNIIIEGKHLHVTTPVKEDASTNTTDKEDSTKEGKKGETEVSGERKTAVMGNDGVAGIKIKGGDVDLEIESLPANNANPTTSSPLIAPKDADDVVINNHGVAGIDIEGTGKVKVVIGKENPPTTM